jgi:hypothetical protein
MTANSFGVLSANSIRVDGSVALLSDGEDSESLVGVTSLDGGAYVVRWVTDTDGDGEPDGLAVQRFDADGTKRGGVTVLQGISSDLLNSVSDDVSYDLQALDNGGYVLTYGLQAEEEESQATVTASASGQTLTVPLIGRPTEFYVGSAPAGATFALAGLDSNGTRITVALTPVDGQISITSAILDQFSNDNRLTLQVKGLNQGESANVYVSTNPEWYYDVSAPLANVASSSIIGSGGVGAIFAAQGRAETFHVDSVSYANGTGPTFALLQITTANGWLDLTGLSGAIRLPNGVFQIPVTADASGTYRVPASILAQLGNEDASSVLILGGLTAGSTLAGTVGNRAPLTIPEGVFVQTFNANGVALSADGVRVDGSAALLSDGEESESLVGVTSLDGGAYVVHWVTDIDGDGEPDGLAVQRFAADGTKQGGVTVLQGISSDLLSSVSDDVSYDLQALDNGGYVLTYGLQAEEEESQATVTASASGQTLTVPLIGRPTEFYVGSAPAGATFALAGFDNNGTRITVALTPVDGQISITSAILDQFSNDNRLTLQVKGLNQGESANVYVSTNPEWYYDVSAPLANVASSSIIGSGGVGAIFAAQGRAETFHVDSVSYANGTGPTFALLQITTANGWLDLTGLSGAIRLPNGVFQIPVTADASGTYRVPASILAQLGNEDASSVLILGGLTAGSTLAGTVGNRAPLTIPEGVFVQTFNANGVASLNLTGTDGADVLVGGRGDDQIAGGAGLDLTIYDISRGQALVQNKGGTLTIDTGAQGTDRLTGVEQVQFTDGLYSFQFTSSAGVLVSDFAIGAGGWTSQDLYPRHIGDVNGDGFSDIVGFGQAGVLVSFGSANGSFSAPGVVLGNFGQASGWSSDNQFHREVADVNGDGRADIIGFGYAGTLVSFAKADGTFTTPVTGIANFGTNQGWATQDGFARTTGDVNGDGKADLIGFGYAGTLVSLGNGDGTFQDIKLGIADFGVQQGWTSDNSFHRTVADVNGDGADDIIGFGYAGALVALSKGDGTFEVVKFAINDFGRNQGWSSQNSFARDAADVNGDGFADIVGFGIAGTYIAYGQANGTFSAPSLDVLNFGANQGWTSDSIYHRELADINNDGQMDVVGFGQAGVLAGYNQGYWLA